MAKIQVQGIGMYDDKTLKKKIIDMANSLSKLAKKGEWSKSSENGIRALGRMWGAYQDWSRKNESVNEGPQRDMNVLADYIIDLNIELSNAKILAKKHPKYKKYIKFIQQDIKDANSKLEKIKKKFRSVNEGPDYDLAMKLNKIQTQIFKLVHQYKSKANVPAMIDSFMIGLKNQLKKSRLA